MNTIQIQVTNTNDINTIKDIITKVLAEYKGIDIKIITTDKKNISELFSG